MVAGVHAGAENTQHQNAVRGDGVIDGVALIFEAADVLFDMTVVPAWPGTVRQIAKTPMQAVHIVPRLLQSEMQGGIFVYALHVSFGVFSELVVGHFCANALPGSA